MPDSIPHLLTRKLHIPVALSDEEKRALQETAGPPRAYGSHQSLARENEQSSGVAVIMSGFACQHKTLPDGRRQIVGYFLSGDVCDSSTSVLGRLDYSISTLTRTTIVMLSRRGVTEATSRYPQLARAFWYNALIEGAIRRQWLLNLGRRTALERVSHLFCEVHERLQPLGRAPQAACEFPVTQSELADTVALSTVHVNRTLKELRRSGLVSMCNKEFIIHDLAGLRALAMFDSRYLHPDVGALDWGGPNPSHFDRRCTADDARL